MALKINVRESTEEIIFDLIGSLTSPQDGQNLLSLVRAQVFPKNGHSPSRGRAITACLNFQKIAEMDSHAMQPLEDCLNLVARYGGRLGACGANSQIRKLLLLACNPGRRLGL